MGMKVKGRALNTILLELRLTLPRLVFRPLTLEEALLNPWRGPDINELVISHYDVCRDSLENARLETYEEFCQKMDEQAELHEEERDPQYDVFNFFEYVDLCKASGRSFHYNFREFFAIRYYIMKQRRDAPKYRMYARFVAIAVVICAIVYSLFFAPRIPDTSDIGKDYVRVYINLEVGGDIPFNSYMHTGGYSITNLKTVHHYIRDFYPETTRSGIYRMKDFDYEVKKLNEYKAVGEEIIWDKNFDYIVIPVLIPHDDYVHDRWHDVKKGTPADAMIAEA